MVSNINSELMQAARITEDNSHFCHSLLAFLYLLRGRALFRTRFIILLYCLCLLIRNYDTGKTRFICDTNGNAVIAGLFHSIAVHHITEYRYCFIDRSTRKSTVSRIRETCPQIMGKSVCSKHALIGLFQLRSNTSLSSMCFIRDTNNIASLG